MQPRTKRGVDANRASLADQDQERRLKRILGKSGVAQHPEAHGFDHRPVPGHQGCEGQLACVIATRRKPLQQFPISQTGRAPALQ
jgi:hypothetical protein